MVHKVISRFGAWFLCCFVIAPLQAASFDCRAAATRVERIVCSNPEISKLDEELNKDFRNLMAGGDSERRGHLLTQQRFWLAHSRNVCKDDGCLKRAYLSRIVELENLLNGGNSLYRGGMADICEKLMSSSNLADGSDDFRLSGIEVEEGLLEFHDLDIDKDGKADLLSVTCSGSASMEPSDPCFLNVDLSSGKYFKLEAPRLYLGRFESKIFAVATKFIGSWEHAERSVYLVDDTGINLVCQK